MKSMSFLGKEINETVKTPKGLILAILFLFFGLISPLSARYVNELLASMGGVDFKLPDPTYIDSYGQIFKNLYTILAIVMILVFMGTVVDEKVKGSAILVLTKRLSRPAFIISKFAGASLLFTVVYIVSMMASIYYTYILFSEFFNSGVPMAVLLFWLYGLFIIALTVLASTISKSSSMAAVISFMCYAALAVAGRIPYVGDYLPGVLSGLGMQIIAGGKTVADGILPAVVTAGLIIGLLATAVASFNRQEL